MQALAILYQLREVAFDYGNLPSSGVVSCTLLLLRAASGWPGLLAPPARSIFEATHNDVPKKHEIPPHPKHPRLKKHFFSSRNPMFLLAATIDANGDISGMPSMQPTEQSCTSPPGSTGSEHTPVYPSCVRLLESPLLSSNGDWRFRSLKKSC